MGQITDSPKVTLSTKRVVTDALTKLCPGRQAGGGDISGTGLLGASAMLMGSASPDQGTLHFPHVGGPGTPVPASAHFEAQFGLQHVRCCHVRLVRDLRRDHQSHCHGAAAPRAPGGTPPAVCVPTTGGPSGQRMPPPGVGEGKSRCPVSAGAQRCSSVADGQTPRPLGKRHVEGQPQQEGVTGETSAPGHGVRPRPTSAHGLQGALGGPGAGGTASPGSEGRDRRAWHSAVTAALLTSATWCRQPEGPATARQTGHGGATRHGVPRPWTGGGSPRSDVDEPDTRTPHEDTRR